MFSCAWCKIVGRCPHCPALTLPLFASLSPASVQGYIAKIKTLLVPNLFSNATVAQELADYGIFNPLWAGPAILKQMPPITVQVRGCQYRVCC